MRVLAIGTVYPPHLLGGYEIVWQGVTKQLLRDGHASRVLVTDWRHPDVSPEVDDDPGVVRALDWYWRDHAWPRFTWRERIALERRNAVVVDGQIADFRPDVVAWWPVGGLTLSLIERVRQAGLPSVFFVHDPWPRYAPKQDQWTRMWLPRWRSPAATIAARLTGIPTAYRVPRDGRWVFNSQSMRNAAFPDRQRVPDARTAVVTPGIDQSLLDAAARWVEPQPPEWRWRLLYLGRVVEQKGVDSAVDALALLPPSATLEIVGTGDAAYRETLLRRAAELGVSGRVTLRAQVPRAEALTAYRAADVVLLPARWFEPWGLVPLEAMAAGRPVVATRRGGLAEYLVDGENCLAIPADDPAAIAAQVRRLAAVPVLRARLVSSGRRTAAAHSDAEFRRAAVEEIARAAAPAA